MLSSKGRDKIKALNYEIKILYWVQKKLKVKDEDFSFVFITYAILNIYIERAR